MEDKLLRTLEDRLKCAASRGFTAEYQQQEEEQDNTVCFRKLAPATEAKQERAVADWALWRLSRNEPIHRNFDANEPDPTPQTLKLFAESLIAYRTSLPSVKTVCGYLIAFTSKWERQTSRSISKAVKKDVLNHVRTKLQVKYNLPAAVREPFHVTHQDIKYLQHRLFGDDEHDYGHESARVQIGAALSLFAGSAARAGAVVESSSYRNTNECLYYKHLTFNIKRTSGSEEVKRWVTIDPEFLKGHRYRNDELLPKTWFNSHPVLGLGFLFWVSVIGIADHAFRGISTIDGLLEKRPPKGRESWTLQWNDNVKDRPFFRMVAVGGRSRDRALTFSSLRHHITSLAQRDGFRDPLRVHGIRGGVANKIDPNASTASRNQGLDHKNSATFVKYQSQLKSLDMQALFYDLKPDYECRDMERSMAHHRDPNVPLNLSAEAIAEFMHDDEVVSIDKRIVELTRRIAGEPEKYRDLASERSTLYNTKARKLRSKRGEFTASWWAASYDEYIAGNEFNEKDTTRLFDIYSKYIPERARLKENLFKEASLDSEIGRQCLQDAVNLCVSTERVAYYPGLSPVDGLCPVCSLSMSRVSLQSRAKHILQCRRKSMNAAPYQQRYQNGKRAHRRVGRVFLEFCYLCTIFFDSEAEWARHCETHVQNLQPRCGLLTFRYTLVTPGFCPFCLGDERMPPERQFTQWMKNATLLDHIDDQHLNKLSSEKDILCPHPCCGNTKYKGVTDLKRHFYNVHTLREPRSNCVSRKRRWDFSDDCAQLDETQKNSGVDEARIEELCQPRDECHDPSRSRSKKPCFSPEPREEIDT